MNLDELFKNGLTSLEKGDYDNGAKYFRECGELSKVNGNDQNAAYSFIKEAECHMKNERYIEANHILKIFSKYYKNMSSETGEFLYLYGLNCIHIGFVDKGIALLKQSSQVLSHIPNKTTHSDNLLDNASYVLNDAVKLDYGQAKDSKWLWLRKHLWNSNGNNFFLLLPVIAFMASYFISSENIELVDIFGKIFLTLSISVILYTLYSNNLFTNKIHLSCTCHY